MKKTTLISFISALSCSSFAFAGDMGDGNSGMCVTTFFALEAGYTNNTIDGYDISVVGLNATLAPTKTTNGYSGRLAAGVVDKVYDELALSGEIGWGYYGRTSLNTTLVNSVFYLSNSYTLTGFDALAGIAYVQPSFSLFFKAGALIENMNKSSNLNINSIDGSTFANFALEDNKTEVLPEIKLGGAYNFNDNWALTAAYVHAFGSSVKISGNVDGFGNLSNVKVYNQNPSINTVFIGIQYSL